MAKARGFGSRIALLIALFSSANAWAAMDVSSTVTTLRLANMITGGYMSVDDPLFTQMLAKVQAGDVSGAAAIAADSRYFGNYLARRLALQMQSPSLDASIGKDNDATAFIIAHFVGGSNFKPSISSLWSENATYLVDPTMSGQGKHAADVGSAGLDSIDWSQSLIQMSGQTANVVTVNNGQSANAPGPIPEKHVGGYTTLSDRTNDASFAMYGATAGTNLRMIEGIWEIATGLQLTDVESTSALAQDVPRFVPEYNPNFFHGQGQAACISCHGGGMSSLNHGYATVADMFDFDSDDGFTYFANPTTATMKSLGSDPKKRNSTSTCNLTRTPTPVCNPDSAGVDPNQGWNVSTTWAAAGVLNTMGWTGPTAGQGLNALGNAIGKARIVYEYLTKRVINEICPLGTFSADDISRIAASANPNVQPAGTDDVRTIVVQVASNPSCL